MQDKQMKKTNMLGNTNPNRKTTGSLISKPKATKKPACISLREDIFNVLDKLKKEHNINKNEFVEKLLRKEFIKKGLIEKPTAGNNFI